MQTSKVTGDETCGISVGCKVAEILENEGEQEERTEENLRSYSRCSHLSREHKDSPDLSISEHSWCQSSLELSENVEKVMLKRHRGEEGRQTWGIVQLDGATGGGGKGGAFGGRERSSSESEGDDSSEASGIPHQLHGNCFVGLVFPCEHSLP